MKEIIKDEILRAGFDLIGITDTDVPDYAKNKLIEWIDKKSHAQMYYIERKLKERINLKNLWKDAKTVIAVAKNYYKNVKFKNFMVSIYALSKDYHKIMKKKLLHIFKNLSNKYHFQYKIYVDTGPILEKVFAQKSGIGWQGKNSIIINPKLGSYLFLAVILLDIDLEPDKPFPYDLCGKCRRCIDACPTNAILNDRTVDANKCISYWTIEYKGDEIGLKFKNWVFGCDICQMVCPWNKKAVETDWEDFKKYEILDYTLEELLKMDKKTYDYITISTPLRRATYERFIRNLKHIYENSD